MTFGCESASSVLGPTGSASGEFLHENQPVILGELLTVVARGGLP
ncbi:MAG: hypothetical protein ABWY12_13825 [Burkholderiales bacterium]